MGRSHSAQLPACRCLVVSLRFKAEVDDAIIMNMFRMHSSCWNDYDRYGPCMLNSQQYVNVRIWMFIRRGQVVVCRMCRNLVFDSPLMLDANLLISVTNLDPMCLCIAFESAFICNVLKKVRQSSSPWAHI